MNNQNAIVLSGEDFIEKDGQYWMPATELAQRLGFKGRSDGVKKIFRRNKEELEPFTRRDSLSPLPGLNQKNLIFSEVGCYIVAMLAKTPKAKAFRRALADFLQKYRSGEVSVVTQKLAERLLDSESLRRWYTWRYLISNKENMIRRTKSLSFTKSDYIFRASFDEGLSDDVIARILDIPFHNVNVILNLEKGCRESLQSLEAARGKTAQQLLAEVTS